MASPLPPVESAAPPSESAAPPGASSSPISRLYENVLGCVFGFLSLRDLREVIVVSQPWHRAVESMGSIGATMSVPRLTPLESIAEAPTLARHVGRFDAPIDSALMRLHSSTVALLAERMPQLQSLSCNLFPAPLESELRFPRGLRDVSVIFPSSIGALGVHAALRGLARLPHLASLTLTLRGPIAGLDLLPLASMSALRRLSIHRGLSPSGMWTREQIAVFRSLAWLDFFCLDDLADYIAELLRTPHSIGWTQIADRRGEQLGASESVAALLPSLPTLATLHINSQSPLDYLSALPRLRSLSLHFAYPRPDLSAVQRCLSSCAELTSLSIDDSNADAPFFEQLLPSLPKLQSLSLSQLSKLRSLEFMRHPTVAASLRCFAISQCQLRPDDLLHLAALKRLEDLRVQPSALQFDPSPEMMRQLQPPSTLVPSLLRFRWGSIPRDEEELE